MYDYFGETPPASAKPAAAAPAPSAPASTEIDCARGDVVEILFKHGGCYPPQGTADFVHSASDRKLHVGILGETHETGTIVVLEERIGVLRMCPVANSPSAITLDAGSKLVYTGQLDPGVLAEIECDLLRGYPHGDSIYTFVEAGGARHRVCRYVRARGAERAKFVDVKMLPLREPPLMPLHDTLGDCMDRLPVMERSAVRTQILDAIRLHGKDHAWLPIENVIGHYQLP